MFVLWGCLMSVTHVPMPIRSLRGGAEADPTGFAEPASFVLQ